MSLKKFIMVALVAMGSLFTSNVAKAEIWMAMWGNTLVIQSDGMDNTELVEVSINNGTLFVDYGSSNFLLPVTTDYKKYKASSVRKILYWGGGNSDLFVNETSIPCDAYGNLGEDWLVGGFNDDFLDGGGDNDELIGREGHDELCGRLGADGLYGGADQDILDPGPYKPTGERYLVGGDDKDWFVLGGRQPRLSGDSVLLNAMGLPFGFPFDFEPLEDVIQ